MSVNKTDKQYGFIPQELDPKDWVFGSITAMPKTINRPDGQWDDFLPELEIQRFSWGDTMGCVSYSLLNCLETLQKFRGETVNYSDRFLAKLSGTTSVGNSMRRVAETVRLEGVVDESEYPSTGTSSREEYYQELPQELLGEALAWTQTNTLQYEYVPAHNQDLICESLQYSPLQIAMYAYGPLVDGVHQNTGKTSNHCVEMYGYEYGKYFKIYDHYQRKFKKIAWDYYIRAIYRVNLKRDMPETNPLGLDNNTLVQLVEGQGGVGLFLDDAIMTGPLDKVQFAWLMRNSVDQLDEHKKSLTLEQWNQYAKKDLP